MDWSTRGSHQPQNPNQTAETSASHSRKRGGFNLIQLASVVLLFSATILVVALIWSIFLGSNAKGESKYVTTKQMQAVFLNSGQVYFGNIKTLNDKYMRLDNIYYLRVNQQVQPNQSTQQTQQDISLVKLGCELHGPTDEMLINRDQISFWENLKDDGQVAKAVASYKQQNPNGQKCDTASGTSTDNSSNSTTTTPSTTTKKQ